MTKKASIKPGQVPEWRPGALYWAPLPDGREVTIYPLLGGKARLCVGPLADPNGYDIAYRYPDQNAAETAARKWDSEEEENPPDYEEVEFGQQPFPGAAPVHSGIFQPGAKIALNDTLKKNFKVITQRREKEHELIYLEGITEDRKVVKVEAERRTGDPVDNNQNPIATVISVQIEILPAG